MEKTLPSVERFFQFALLGLVASGYLAIVGSGYAGLPTILLAGVGLLWRLAIICGAWRLQVPDRAVTIATVAYMVFAPVDYFLLSQSWVTATVHVVFFVAIVKTLTARTGRDYLFVAAVAFIELLAAALFSSSGAFFVCLAVYLLCAVAALATSEVRRLSNGGGVVIARPRQSHAASRLVVLSAMMTCGILVLTAGLFFMLPRTANAALQFLASNRYHLTGFSDNVTLGELGELKSDPRPVMHVKSYSRDLPLNLKWRGLALDRFDGHRWSNDPAEMRTQLPERSGMVVVADDPQRRRVGRRILYRVEIQNVDADALFVAGIPEFLNTGSTRISRAPNGAFRFGFVPNETLRYEVYSFIGPDKQAPEPRHWRLSAAEREDDLRLPKLDARIPLLAASMTAGAHSDPERAHLLEQKLRRAYGYSLDLMKDETRDPLATFLFDRKKGYCEYFASAMTVMLRTQGIPARLVNGFQSGVANPYSGMLVIRAADAHTWVEAFLPESGWTVFDPTPIGSAQAEQTVWSRLNLYMDAADTFWRDWVLSYDLGQQLTLASRLQSQARHIQQNGLLTGFTWLRGKARTAYSAVLRDAGGIGLIVAALALTALLIFQARKVRPARKARQGRSDPKDATLLYFRMLRLMKRRGYQKPAWFTPLEFSSSVPVSKAGDLERFTAAYNDVRFGGNSGSSRDMAAALESLGRQSHN